MLMLTDVIVMLVLILIITITPKAVKLVVKASLIVVLFFIGFTIGAIEFIKEKQNV